jgi:hypothetical protein
MTTSRTAPASPRTASARPSALTAGRVGPVVTTVASVVAAVIMFGIGVLAGRVGASIAGVHGAARTAIMLSAGVVLGLASVRGSARRHLPRG